MKGTGRLCGVIVQLCIVFGNRKFPEAIIISSIQQYQPRITFAIETFNLNLKRTAKAP